MYKLPDKLKLHTILRRFTTDRFGALFKQTGKFTDGILIVLLIKISKETSYDGTGSTYPTPTMDIKLRMGIAFMN